MVVSGPHLAVVGLVLTRDHSEQRRFTTAVKPDFSYFWKPLRNSVRENEVHFGLVERTSDYAHFARQYTLASFGTKWHHTTVYEKTEYSVWPESG